MSFSSSEADFTITCGDVSFEVKLDEKCMAKSVSSMLIEPFVSGYNKRNGTKMTVYNVFNIAVGGEPLPQSVKDVLAYPARTLSGGPSTQITLELIEAAHVSVSAGETHTEVSLATKFLKGSVGDSLVGPFLSYYNKANGTKMKKSNVKGLVFDGETPMEALASILKMHTHAIIKDPRKTEIRVLLG